MQKDIYEEILARAESLRSENLLTEEPYLKKLFDLLNLGFINHKIRDNQTDYLVWKDLQMPTLNEEQKAQGSWERSAEPRKQQFFKRCQDFAKPLIAKPPAPKSLWQQVVDLISPNRVLAEKHIEERASEFRLLHFFTTQLSGVTSDKIAERGVRLWQDIHLLTDMVTRVNAQIDFYEKQSQRYAWSPFGAFAWGRYKRQKNQCQLLKKKMKTHLEKYIKQLKKASSLSEISLPQFQKEAVLVHVKNLEEKCRTMGIREDFSVLKKHLIELYLRDFLKPRLRAAGESGDEGRVFPKSLIDLASDLHMEGAMAKIKSAWELNAGQMPTLQEIKVAFYQIFNAENRLLTDDESEILKSFITKLCQKINCENHTCYPWLEKEKDSENTQLKTAWNKIQLDRATLLSEVHETITKQEEPAQDMALVLQGERNSLKEDIFKFLKIETILAHVKKVVDEDYHGHSENAWIFLKSIDDETPGNVEEKVEEESRFLYVYAKKRCLCLLDQRNFMGALSSQSVKYFCDLIAKDEEVQNKIQSLFERMPSQVPDLMKLYQVVKEYGSCTTKQSFTDKLSENSAYKRCANYFLIQNRQLDIPDAFLIDPKFKDALRDIIINNPLLIDIQALMSLRNKPDLTDVIDDALNDLFDKSLKNFVHPNNNPGLSRKLDGIAKAYNELDTPAHAHRALCWYCLGDVRLSPAENQKELQRQLNSLLQLLPSEPRKHALEYFLMLCQVHFLSLAPAQKSRVKGFYKNFLLVNTTNFEPCSSYANQFQQELLNLAFDFSLVKKAKCLPPDARTYTPPPSPRKASSPGARFGSGRVDWDSKSLQSSGSDNSLGSESEELISSSTRSSLLGSDCFGSDSLESKSDTDHWVSMPASLRPARSCGEENRSKTIQSANELIDALQNKDRHEISDQAVSLVDSYRVRGMVDREMLFWDLIAEYIVGAIRCQNYGGKNFNQWWQKVGDCFFNALSSATSDVPPHFLMSIMNNYRVHMVKLDQLKASLNCASDDPASFIPQNIAREVDYFRCVLVAGLAENDTFFAELVCCLQKLSEKIGEIPERQIDIGDWKTLNREIKDVLAMTATVQ